LHSRAERLQAAQTRVVVVSGPHARRQRVRERDRDRILMNRVESGDVPAVQAAMPLLVAVIDVAATIGRGDYGTVQGIARHLRGSLGQPSPWIRIEGTHDTELAEHEAVIVEVHPLVRLAVLPAFAVVLPEDVSSAGVRCAARILREAIVTDVESAI